MNKRRNSINVVFNPLQPRQPYLTPNFEFHYFTSYIKLIDFKYVFKIFFSKNEHFDPFNKTYAVSPTKIIVTFLFMPFPKILCLINKDLILLTIFWHGKGRPYYVDFE